jgi:S-adenosylmethionine-diacylgycerolhomoserine-N-methlytransferase
MYRYQRYFYDATRKYYLLGRDRMIAEMNPQPGETVLEIGCGTGRNLIVLAQRYPQTSFFGLDASSEMLATAQAKIDTKGLRNVWLRTALADDFGFRETFRLANPFDAIFFSYSLSMIPGWQESIALALQNLSRGGRLYIVDFYDQGELPVWFRQLLKHWLKRFHVQFWNGLLPHLERLQEQRIGDLDITPIARRYAFLARLEKTAQPSSDAATELTPYLR